MTPDLHDAAVNAVAVAAIAYQQEAMALANILSCAAGHGLTVDELVSASGFDRAFVTRLLAEAE